MKIYGIHRRYLCLLLLAFLMSATSAVWFLDAQDNARNVRVVENCGRSVKLEWDRMKDDDTYLLDDYGNQIFLGANWRNILRCG